MDSRLFQKNWVYCSVKKSMQIHLLQRRTITNDPESKSFKTVP